MQTVTIESTQVVAALTVVVNVPIHAKAKQAFTEVSSALHLVSSQQETVQTQMEQLSWGMEQMRVERIGDVKSTVQVKAMLQHTLSTSSSLETRIGQAEAEQVQACSFA